MGFVDCQTVYDSVDRCLLWDSEVLARYGIPAEVIAIILQFHCGVGASVLCDHGGCLEQFQVEQCRRQKCMLSPLLLFNVFFAASIDIIILQFGK